MTESHTLIHQCDSLSHKASSISDHDAHVPKNVFSHSSTKMWYVDFMRITIRVSGCDMTLQVTIIPFFQFLVLWTFVRNDSVIYSCSVQLIK